MTQESDNDRGAQFETEIDKMKREIDVENYALQLSSGRVFKPPLGGKSIVTKITESLRSLPETPNGWAQAASGPERYIWVRGYSAVILERDGFLSWRCEVESPRFGRQGEIGTREIATGTSWKQAREAAKDGLES